MIVNSPSWDLQEKIAVSYELKIYIYIYINNIVIFSIRGRCKT
jgi:hypothetical protein